MFKNAAYLLALLVLLALTACQEEEAEQPLPTRFDVEALSTENAATAFAEATLNAPTPTNTDVRTPLPPTYTPTETPTPIPPTEPPALEEAGAEVAGTIYYIYNGDALIAVAGDGSREEFIYTVGMDISLEYLTPSADGQWLAFVAPGSGSAREVWIINRDGTQAQQVSCLGFGEVRLPAWSPDGAWIAFAATQAPGGPLDIYEASVSGPACAEGTQRQLVDANSMAVGGLAYAPEGGELFFSNSVIYAVDLDSRVVSPPLTQNTGFGADYALAFSPRETTLLTYLQVTPSLTPTRDEGYLIALDVVRTDRLITPEFDMRAPTTSYQWSHNGRSILTSSQDSIYVIDRRDRTGSGIVVGTAFWPQAVFNPTDDHIAYIDADPNNPSLPQIYTVRLSGRNPTQITHNSEGTIADMIWLAGGW